MEEFLNIPTTKFLGRKIDNTTNLTAPLLITDTKKRKIKITSATKPTIIIYNSAPIVSAIQIEMDSDTYLHLIVIGGVSEILDLQLSMGENSKADICSLQFGGSVFNFDTKLVGKGADYNLYGAFVIGGKESATTSVNTTHSVGECVSCSVVKGVAYDNAVGRFSGLVYVAPNAQHTNAEQNSRNITLDNGRITTLPQLEIYADDVRCCHGATVGQASEEQIYYMQQRGIDASTARRMLLEGMVADIINHCMVEPLREQLMEQLIKKLGGYAI